MSRFALVAAMEAVALFLTGAALHVLGRHLDDRTDDE